MGPKIRTVKMNIFNSDLLAVCPALGPLEHTNSTYFGLVKGLGMYRCSQNCMSPRAAPAGDNRGRTDSERTSFTSGAGEVLEILKPPVVKTLGKKSAQTLDCQPPVPLKFGQSRLLER